SLSRGDPPMTASAATTVSSATRSLDSLGVADVPIAGGKGANLGELIRAGFPVPPGFVVTADAFLDAMERGGVRQFLHDAVRAAAGAAPEEVERLAAESRARIA